MIVLGDFDISFPLPALRETFIAIGVILLVLIVAALFIVKSSNEFQIKALPEPMASCSRKSYIANRKFICPWFV